MKLKGWHAFALVSIVVLAAYYPALSAPLNSVDDVRMVNDLLNRSNFAWQDFLFPSSKSYYRPLINTSFIIDYFLWGLEPPFLHLENLLLHWLNTLLLFFLVRQVAGFLGLNSTHTPFFATLLFGLHPINTEAVIWVAGRADLMATSFILLTFICAFQYLKRQSFVWSVSTAIMLFVGCLAKETVLFVWPGLLLLGSFANRSSGASRSLKCFSLFRAMLPSLVCVLSIVCYFLLRFFALHGRDLGLRQVEKALSHSVTGGNSPVSSVNFLWLDNLEHGVTVAGYYARKVVVPFPLNFGIVEVPETYFWPGLLLVLICLYFLFNLSLPRVFFLTAISLGSIALLVSYGGISWTPVAERYMYAPTALVSSWLSLTSAQVLRGKPFYWPRLVSLALCIVVCFSAVGIYRRALVWQSNVALFEDTVNKSPGFQTAQSELASALMKRGDKERAYAILRGLDVPDFQPTSLNIVSVWIHDGEYERARTYLNKRLENPSAYDRAIFELLIDVAILMGHGSSDQVEIRVHQEEVLSYINELWQRTREPFYLYRRGRQQMTMGYRNEARQSFAEASKLFPEDSIYKQPAGKLAETLE